MLDVILLKTISCAWIAGSFLSKLLDDSQICLGVCTVHVCEAVCTLVHRIPPIARLRQVRVCPLRLIAGISFLHSAYLHYVLGRVPDFQITVREIAGQGGSDECCCCSCVGEYRLAMRILASELADTAQRASVFQITVFDHRLHFLLCSHVQRRSCDEHRAPKVW